MKIFVRPRPGKAGGIGSILYLVWKAYANYTTATQVPDDVRRALNLVENPFSWIVFLIFAGLLVWGVWPHEKQKVVAVPRTEPAPQPPPMAEFEPPPARHPLLVTEIEALLEHKRERRTVLEGLLKRMNEARGPALVAARKAKHEQSDLGSLRDRPVQEPGYLADQVLQMLKPDWSQISFADWMLDRVDEHDSDEEMPDPRLREMYRKSIRKANFADEQGRLGLDAFDYEIKELKRRLRENFT